MNHTQSQGFQKILRSLLAVILVVVVSPAMAGEPNPSANPALANVLRQGSTAYYLGTRGGLDGWLIVKNNQVQIAYAVPGGSDLLIGAMFGPSGESISSAQVDAILTTHPELKQGLVSAAGPAAMAGAPTIPTAAIANAAAQVTNALQGQMQTYTPPVTEAVPMPSPGERLMKDLQGAAGVVVGSESAPLLLMVMDPTCPHCKKTWLALRDKVMGNALQVRLVPVTRNVESADDEAAAAQLMHVANPLEAWDKYVAGDKNQLAGKPDADLIRSVRANRELIDSWKIRSTPFLVYRGKDGKVKLVEGEPEKPEAVLSDLLP